MRICNLQATDFNWLDLANHFLLKTVIKKNVKENLRSQRNKQKYFYLLQLRFCFLLFVVRFRFFFINLEWIFVLETLEFWFFWCKLIFWVFSHHLVYNSTIPCGMAWLNLWNVNIFLFFACKSSIFEFMLNSLRLRNKFLKSFLAI